MKNIKITVMNSDKNGRPKIYKLNRLITREDITSKTIEQVRQDNPLLYYKNGNVASVHAEITDKNITKQILKLIGRDYENKNIDISSQWNECNGLWWNQFCIRIYDTTPVQGNTIFHATGQEEYKNLIDNIINIINNSL